MTKVRCRHCGDIIESIAPYDYKRCKCGKTFLDDGEGYFRTTPDAEFINDKI